MANLLTTGMTWLEGQMKEHCSSSVTYRRGGADSTVDAVPGKTDFEVADDLGFSTGAFVWDFMIAAADLGFEPAVGDIIIHASRQFEVMRLPGQGCWRFTGTTQSTYRIHTKDVGAAT